MSADGSDEFGKRRPPPPTPAVPPLKRSQKVVLLVMGTIAVGATANALMPKQKSNAEASAHTATSEDRGTSSAWQSGSGGDWAQSILGDTRRSSGGGWTQSIVGETDRGGFGSFGNAFTTHFSGGG
ncbi:hypothetical protein RPB_3914 [Rhodopseudomonas palustris HaA2]|uniref:Uncharacterized protein n=1 Tax=Rhodopseudomonas palustris (strain HaA2) TaxID=316058 RepID=Q2IT53_RHOP2|nr:hypothetical protein [Rhodopseudomonas palustris]ABD08607.1 hypothetical protein RPB_3914 [Rhodopseudomonas palustris HaA2]